MWQLLAVLDDWEQALDEGRSVHAAFLDVSKAFDRVDHGLLLFKLCSIGVSESSLQWFKDYLQNRQICTAVDGERSSLLPVSSGVPQGSVLGPMLFVVFFADLPAAFSSSSALYADDTLAYNSSCGATRPGGTVPCCNLVGDLQALGRWSATWNTKFNAAKSAHMVIAKRHADSMTWSSVSELKLNSDKVPLRSEVRHLGMIITPDLQWSTHLHDLLKRVSHRVYILKRLAYCFSSSLIVKRLYTAFLRPSLEYASVVWDSKCLRCDRIALERVQLSIARAIYLKWQRQSHSNAETLQCIGWPTLSWRRRRAKLAMFRQLLNGGGPPSLQAVACRTAEARTSYSLRNKLGVEFPSCLSASRLRSFLPSVIAL